MRIERHTNAAVINRILNAPEVRPWIADMSDGDIDVSDKVADQRNICLVGQHGAFLCFKVLDGFYEVHTQVLRSGRGEWAREFAQCGAEYMFCATDCIEIMTRVPDGHVAAKALTLSMGFKHRFERECVWRGQRVPAHIYSLPIQDWADDAPGMQEVGQQFHDQLLAEARRLGITDAPHDEDPSHNQHVGIALVMAMNGQVRKGVAWYARWAFAARHRPIQFVSDDPPRVRSDIGIIELQPDGSIRVTPCA